MNKRSEILDLIDSEKPHVLALTEFGAARSTGDNELGINEYTIYRGDHSDGKGGLGKGAALYVHNSLNHSACPALETEEFDCAAWCAIKLNDNKTMLVGTIYRSPSSDDQNNAKLLETMKKAASLKHDFLVLSGDYNLPKIDWSANQCLDTEGSFSMAFLENVENLGLVQHVQTSTRFRGQQDSCLDLVFTNEEDMVNEMAEMPPLGKSDHLCQKWKVVVTEPMFRNTMLRRPNFKKANWKGFKEDLENFQLDQEDSADTMNEKLTKKIHELKLKHVPFCKPKNDKNRLPWMVGAKMKEQRKEKWKKWKVFTRTGLPRDYDAYKMERNKLGDMIRSKKANYEKGLITDMKDNPNLFHGHCRRSLKTKQGVSNVLDANGKLTETEDEAAQALNKYYHSVFTKDEGVTPPPPIQNQTDQKIEDVYLCKENVEEVLSKLNPNKAAGPDEVQSRIMKECAKELAPKLNQIYRKSLDESQVPSKWKEAHIVPIHKGGSKATMANFRPVALTSIICKAMERILFSAIMSHLMANNLITEQQHGFVKGRSCQTNILLCLEKWTEMIDAGHSVDVAYFDYAKAFDKVSHRLLLVKLKAYGIDGKLRDWLKDYLEDRKQQVVVGNVGMAGGCQWHNTGNSPWIPSVPAIHQ